jgi:hypothetical protein
MRSSLRLLALAALVASAAAGVTDQQRNTIYQITSLFENSTPILKYNFCANINDGRGLTAGFAGFTSGTGQGGEAHTHDEARMHREERAASPDGSHSHARMSTR